MNRSFLFFLVFLFHLNFTVAAADSLEFRLAASADDVRLCQALRHQIFVQEQKVPAETELDGKDHEALHTMCWNKNDGALVATGRCLLVEQHQQKEAILGRIAVRTEYRGRGIGQQVVRQLEQQAARRNVIRVSLTPHSYLHDFYARLGYHNVPGTGLIPVNEHCTLIQMEKWLE